MTYNSICNNNHHRAVYHTAYAALSMNETQMNKNKTNRAKLKRTLRKLNI